MKTQFLNMKTEGYYIEKSHDSRRNYTQFQLKKDTREGTGTIFCEFNKAGFLQIQKEINFPVKEKETTFLNFIPFAERNKTAEPLKETFDEKVSKTESYFN